MAARGPKSDKLWSEAVRMAALREMEDPHTPGEKRKRLAIIADNLVRMAVAGDMAAITEVGNRIDGKPKQQTEVSGPDGGAVQFEDTTNDAAAFARRMAGLAARAHGPRDEGDEPGGQGGA